MLSFNISNPAPYTAYRIVITVCGDNKAPAGQRTTVQIGQWNLFNSNNPTLYIAPILKSKTSNYKVGLLPLTFSSVKSIELYNRPPSELVLDERRSGYKPTKSYFDIVVAY